MSAPVSEHPFGWSAARFCLPDTDGRTWTPEELRGPNGLVIAFICNHCPYVLAIADRLAEEGRALGDLGVGMAAICSNDADSHPADGFEAMGVFAREHDFTFPYLHDESQDVARAYGAVCTPDFFGFDAGLALRYRGRLDDAGRETRPGARRELREAMAMIGRTGRGPAEQNPSIGCSIKWKRA
jgi:peroxiredoxin